MLYKEDKVNLIIALLRGYGIRDVVLCPGSRNAVIVNNILTCGDAFRCYPVTDERSAGFFALGISMKGSPAAVVVTSGSALLNLMPAVAEACHQRIPLCVISADRPHEDIGMNVGQTIVQPGVIQQFCVRSVNLVPAEKSTPWYHRRLVSEALAMMLRDSMPVHVNVPLAAPADCPVSDIEDIPRMERIPLIDSPFGAGCIDRLLLDELCGASRPVLLVGEDHVLRLHPEVVAALRRHIVVLSEPLTDAHARPFDGIIQSMPESLAPDLLLYVGGSNVCRAILGRFAAIDGLRVWRIDPTGAFVSPFGCLDRVVRAEPLAFLRALADALEHTPEGEHGNGLAPSAFYDSWMEAFDVEESRLAATFDEMQLTAASVVKYFEEQLDDMDYDFHVHYANSSAVRLACRYASGHVVYCNRGVNGIEGTLSTAAGFAAAVDSSEMVFCVIGDLSFFYDQNALWNQNLRGNLRVILLNDRHGSIFDHVAGLEHCTSRDRYVAGRHEADARGICTQNDIGYLSAKTIDEMHLGIVRLLTEESSRPMVLEVFCP